MMDTNQLCDKQAESPSCETRLERDRRDCKEQEKSDWVGGKFTQPPFSISSHSLPRFDQITNQQQPFFNLVLQAGNARLAAQFIPKCTNLEAGAAITMYEKCGMRIKAAEEAVKSRDADAWMRLLEAAGGRNTSEGKEIERLGAQVFKK
jgi:hypothetical protein